MRNRNVVNIIGAGLAGMEAGLFLAGHGVKVHIFNNGKIYRDSQSDMEKLSPSGELYDKLLTQELSLLGSPLARKKDQLERSKSNCIDQLLLSYGLDMISDNENIEVFDANVKNINPMELTIIATGPKTGDELFDYLIDKYGTMKCVNALPIYPIIDGIDEVYLYHKEGDTYFLSIAEEEYNDLVKEIIKQAVEERKSVEEFKLYQNTVEDLALHYRENLRSYSLKPQRVNEGDKPYATMVLKKVEDGYVLQGISSDLSQARQYKILSTLKAFRNFKFVKIAGVNKGKFINPIHMTTQFCQSRQEENVFFAGGIMGIGGNINSIASGMWTAMNVLRKVENKNMVKMPLGCAFGKFIQTLTGDNLARIRPLIKCEDIINIAQGEDIEKFVISSFEQSQRALEQFKEEYKNGKYV
ncbi:MAG: FAD-dependent oxidoreductase [Clostridia bacterium]|nr:FAD-dependent oxidoreductase [Clostridia bacterium]